jgi:predicted transcriptional regulator YdeE
MERRLQMAEIIKVYRESLPELRLIGKRYVDGDRGKDGGFSGQWEEWFQRGWFKPLEALGSLPENEDACVGCMRCANGFEYWIGMFFPAGTAVPEGYAYVDIPAGDIGVCWIQGRAETGELYGQEIHDACFGRIREAGWLPACDAWFFERYNCPRFTTPDETGKVILDYCVYLERA